MDFTNFKRILDPKIVPNTYQVYKETEYLYCLRCGRKLKNAEYRKVGMGKICLEKSKHGPTPLFRLKDNADSKDKPDTK